MFKIYRRNTITDTEIIMIPIVYLTVSTPSYTHNFLSMRTSAFYDMPGISNSGRYIKC